MSSGGPVSRAVAGLRIERGHGRIFKPVDQGFERFTVGKAEPAEQRRAEGGLLLVLVDIDELGDMVGVQPAGGRIGVLHGVPHTEQISAHAVVGGEQPEFVKGGFDDVDRLSAEARTS